MSTTPEDRGSSTRTVEAVDQISVGDSVTYTQTVSEDDVEAFAGASGDHNPLHLDDEYASETFFGGRIAHGLLTAGLVSAALARLPGLVIYKSQNMSFEGPVPIGAEVTATVEVEEAHEDGSLTVSTTAERADGEVVLSGTADILVRPEPTEA